VKTRRVKKIVSVNKHRYTPAMPEFPGRIRRHIKLHLIKPSFVKIFEINANCSRILRKDESGVLFCFLYFKVLKVFNANQCIIYD
jgi:hypothetical protein